MLFLKRSKGLTCPSKKHMHDSVLRSDPTEKNEGKDSNY